MCCAIYAPRGLKNGKILHDFVRYFAENSGDWDRSIYCPTAKGHQKEMNKFKRQEEIKKKYEEITIGTGAPNVQNLAIGPSIGPKRCLGNWKTSIRTDTPQNFNFLQSKDQLRHL